MESEERTGAHFRWRHIRSGVSPPMGGSKISDPVLFDCAAVARALEASRFIPGFHHGHPRAMRYYESVYTGSDRSSCFPNW